MKQDNNVNRLLGTLKYKAMYGFRATTSHVTFHDLDDVVDEDGNMYKWRSATNSTGKAVSHSESESTSSNKAQESENEYRPSNSGKALALPEKRLLPTARTDRYWDLVDVKRRCTAIDTQMSHVQSELNRHALLLHTLQHNTLPSPTNLFNNELLPPEFIRLRLQAANATTN